MLRIMRDVGVDNLETIETRLGRAINRLARKTCNVLSGNCFRIVNDGNILVSEEGVCVGLLYVSADKTSHGEIVCRSVSGLLKTKRDPTQRDENKSEAEIKHTNYEFEVIVLLQSLTHIFDISRGPHHLT